MKKLFVFLAFSASIFSCGAPTPETGEQAPEADSLSTSEGSIEVTEKFCFQLVEAKGEKIDSTIMRFQLTGDSLIGRLDWIPYQEHSARGTFKGKKEGQELRITYYYTIEGSNQVEEMIYKWEGDQLIKKEGELEEIKGVLMLKNPEQATFTGQPLVQVPCSSMSF